MSGVKTGRLLGCSYARVVQKRSFAPLPFRDTRQPNLMLHELVRAGKHSREDVNLILWRMVQENIAPDIYTYNSMLLAASRRRDHKDMLSIFEEMKSGDVGVKPDITSYNQILATFAEYGDLKKCEEWMKKIEDDTSVTPTVVTYNTMIHASSRKGDAERATYWVLQLKSAGLEPDLMTFSSLSDAFSKSGSAAGAAHVLHQMDVEPNVRSYNIVIESFSRKGDTKSALAYYQKMLDARLEPSNLTFSSLIESVVNAAAPASAAARRAAADARTASGANRQGGTRQIDDNARRVAKEREFQRKVTQAAERGDTRQTALRLKELQKANFHPNQQIVDSVLSVFDKEGFLLGGHRALLKAYAFLRDQASAEKFVCNLLFPDGDENVLPSRKLAWQKNVDGKCFAYVILACLRNTDMTRALFWWRAMKSAQCFPDSDTLQNFCFKID